ncbi:MAG: rRNA pseudouridine synthase [Bacteroidetes bacterium]|nr:MAG: rRNA pseudouridine synthase [Bacteroidota bacterium]
MREQGKKPFGKSGKNRPSEEGRERKPSRPDDRKKFGDSAEKPKRRFSDSKPTGKPRLGGKGKKRPIEVEDANPLPRLNQFIAKAGVCSRREADELIATGKIEVNGKVIREMGYRVQRDDKVKYEGKLLRGEELRYLLLNKPKNFITTTSDEKGRKTVMDLVKNACSERIYPVGRLDKDTTGLLLFTNDGELAKKLTHPSSLIKKIYHVYLDKPMTEEHLDAMNEGVELEDGFMKPDIVNYVLEQPNGTELGIQLHSGKNRVVRRLFEHFGYKVIKLDRSLFANLTKKDIPRGKWRFLRDNEITMLKQLAGRTTKKQRSKD